MITRASGGGIAGSTPLRGRGLPALCRTLPNEGVYTDFELKRLPAAGAKNLLVLSPAFVADCLETLEELSVAGKETFLQSGGISFKQIPCLNDHAAYISLLANRTRRWLEK